MAVYLDNYSYCLARRVQKCGARKFKLADGRDDPYPDALLIQSMFLWRSGTSGLLYMYVCMYVYFDNAGTTQLQTTFRSLTNRLAGSGPPITLCQSEQHCKLTCILRIS
jgi:hypothetical protein